jgi:hypothetical protein
MVDAQKWRRSNRVVIDSGADVEPAVLSLLYPADLLA